MLCPRRMGGWEVNPYGLPLDSAGNLLITTTTMLFGSTPGAVQVTATAAGLAPVRFNLTVVAAEAVRAPELTSIFSAGGSQPVVQDLAPLSTAFAAGNNLAANEQTITAGAGDITEGRLPLVLGGTCVEFAGQRAPVLSVSTKAVAFIVPDADPAPLPSRC